MEGQIAMQQPKELPRPEKRLIEISKRYPEAWANIDAARAANQTLGNGWPPHTFIPRETAFEIVRKNYKGQGQKLLQMMQMVQDIHDIECLGAWRTTKGIYRYDPTLYQELIKTPIEGNLPCEALRHMPEWCVYVETPGMTYLSAPLDGFFATIEYDFADQKERLLILMDAEPLSQGVTIMLGDWTIKEAIIKTRDSSAVGMVEEMLCGPDGITAVTKEEVIDMGVSHTAPIISLLVYLCSESAEIGDGSSMPETPVPVKTKRGPRIFPADKPKVWPVGTRLGAALRHAFTEAETTKTDRLGTHASPRAHVRVAHWHSFWTGARKIQEQRKLIVKWLPPIPVNVANVDDLPVTIKMVEKG